MPIKRQIKIAKAEIISGKPPDVFFVFILVFICMYNNDLFLISKLKQKSFDVKMNSKVFL